MIDGAHILKNARTGKGRRSPQWNDLAEADLLDSASLSRIYDTTDPPSAHFQFLAATLSVLRGSIGSPYHLLSDCAVEAPPANDDSDPDREHKAVAHLAADADEECSLDQEDDRRRREDLVPDIGARLSSSDYTTYAEKLGFVTRDYLDPDDLALVSKELVRHLNCNDQEPATYALFALVSLLTGCSDFLAYKLRFEPGHSIWLNIEGDAWCWSFSAYRQQRDETDQPIIEEPISVALPMSVAKRLRELRITHPTVATFGELISTALGSQIELRKFRLFLRSCGNAAHPAYASRFAKSMPFVFLRTCASDMTAAMLSAHFAVAAPAALFYFGPTYGVLRERLRDAYAFLGLDAPVEIRNALERAGCQKVLEPAQLRAGWSGLEKEIDRVHARILSPVSESIRLADINQLMVLLCASFVIRTAHRGTRLERLTFGAMLLHEDAVLISDKDEFEREQPRLIPKSPIIKRLICLAVDLHRMVKSDQSNAFPHDSCVFVQWLNNCYQNMRPITTGAIAMVIAQFFDGADFNFGRSAWVTHLDEDGCDRWLTRGLTGHARDVTRTNGAYFDVPPLESVSRLAVVMERTGNRLFGGADVAQDEKAPVVEFRASGRARPVRDAAFKVPDPRTVLNPLSVEILAGWRATQRVRHALLHGSIDAPAAVLAVLHMLFMDFAPVPELCVSALKDPGRFLRCHGNAVGLLWQRPHFVHDTWLPLLPTTALLIANALKERMPERRLWDRLALALRVIDPGYWPGSTEGCKAALPDATRAFLRLEFRPSLLAASDLQVPAPTLSHLSLMRLSDPAKVAVTFPPTPTRVASKRSSDPEFKELRKIISDFVLQTERRGELRKRALDCHKQIRAEVEVQDAFGTWLLDWVLSELTRSAEGLKGRLDISSISTYLTVLTHGPHALREMNLDDPYEWTDEQWQKWLYALNTNICGDPGALSVGSDPDRTATTGTPPLHKRVKDAVGRLVRNLIARQHWVPLSIRSVLAEGNETLPTGSASSCLITEADVERSIQISDRWLEDQPLDKLMVKTRARIQFEIPTRTSDISNLRVDGLTPNGFLVISRVGYKNIKTDNSVRTVKAPVAVQQSLAEFREQQQLYQPNAEFLFRGEGTPEAGARDRGLVNLLSSALKHGTGDPSARPHALRSSALQNGAWPGWQQLATQLLNAQASPQTCYEWIGPTSDWTRMAYTVSTAGHGDLRAALGNYMSGWPLVFGICSMALLHGTAPRSGFLTQLGIAPATLRKFRHRSSGVACEWEWVFARIAASAIKVLKARLRDSAGTEGSPPVDDGIQSARGDQAASVQDAPSIDLEKDRVCSTKRTSVDKPKVHAVDVCYLSARILGMDTSEAIEKAELGLARATELDGRLPSTGLRLMASSRARGGAQDRGRNGNLDCLFSSRGQEILNWLASLPVADLSMAVQFVYRLRTKGLSAKEMTKFWRSLFTGLPTSCALHIHRGQLHIGDDERSLLFAHAELAISVIDGEIGEIPAIRIVTRGVDNRVVGTRLNSVFRAGLLAHASFLGAIRDVD